MTKSIIAIIFAILPVTAGAQTGWELPTNTKQQAENIAKKEKKEKKEKAGETKKKGTLTPDMKDYEYLLPGVVPQDEKGDVVFKLDIEKPGYTAQQMYDCTYAALDSLTKEECWIKGGIVLINKNDKGIAGQYTEWLTFKQNLICLDQSKFNYTIIAKCTEGQLHLTLEHISYLYEEDRPTAMRVSAEEWITDKNAVNKKGTRLLPMSAKFRRATIDRVKEIFAFIKQNIEKDNK